MIANRTPILPLLILFPWVGIDHTHARGDGAPSSTCTNGMTPGHGAQPGTASPYAISLGAVTTYTPGMKLPVTVTGTFKGILMQAQKTADNAPVGKFVDLTGADLKLMTCINQDNSLTHANPNDKTGATVMWMPPDTDVGAINFVATIAQEKAQWWKDNKSGSLTFQAAETQPPATQPPATQPGATETPTPTPTQPTPTPTKQGGSTSNMNSSITTPATMKSTTKGKGNAPGTFSSVAILVVTVLYTTLILM